MSDQEKQQTTNDSLSLSEMAYLAGTSCDVIESMVVYELIRPVCTKPVPTFSPDQTVEVLKLVRLHVQLEVSWDSMELVLNLLERIQKLEEQREN